MNSLFSALLLASVSLAVLAGKTNIPENEVAELEKELASAPLQIVEAEFDDGDPTKRIFNPFAWIRNKLRNKCTCEAAKCDCCFKLKFLQNVICFSAGTNEAAKQLDINLKFDEQVLVAKKFNLNREDKVCGAVSVIPFANYCFIHQSSLSEDGVLTSCPRVELRVRETLGAIIQLSCLEAKNGQLSFSGFQTIEKSDMLVLKVKNPFTLAVDWYRKKKQQQQAQELLEYAI